MTILLIIILTHVKRFAPGKFCASFWALLFITVDKLLILHLYLLSANIEQLCLFICLAKFKLFCLTHQVAEAILICKEFAPWFFKARFYTLIVDSLQLNIWNLFVYCLILIWFDTLKKAPSICCSCFELI